MESQRGMCSRGLGPIPRAGPGLEVHPRSGGWGARSLAARQLPGVGVRSLPGPSVGMAWELCGVCKGGRRGTVCHGQVAGGPSPRAAARLEGVGFPFSLKACLPPAPWAEPFCSSSFSSIEPMLSLFMCVLVYVREPAGGGLTHRVCVNFRGDHELPA